MKGAGVGQHGQGQRLLCGEACCRRSGEGRCNQIGKSGMKNRFNWIIPTNLLVGYRSEGRV